MGKSAKIRHRRRYRARVKKFTPTVAMALKKTIDDMLDDAIFETSCFLSLLTTAPRGTEHTIGYICRG